MQPENLSVKERIEISVDPKIKQQRVFILVAGFDPVSHKPKNTDQQYLDTLYANLTAKFEPIFSKLGINVTVVEVTMANFKSKIVSLCSIPTQTTLSFIVFAMETRMMIFPAQASTSSLNSKATLQQGRVPSLPKYQ